VYSHILPLSDGSCMTYTFNFLVSLNHVLKSRNLCFILHYYNFRFCIALRNCFILWKINITLFPSLADAGYLTAVTVQHTIFNETCNSASLECPYNIRQSPGTRPQPHNGNFEIHWRKIKFSVIKSIIFFIYIYIYTHTLMYIYIYIYIYKVVQIWPVLICM